MSDQCVPSSEAPEEESTGLKRCASLRKRGKHSHGNSESGSRILNQMNTRKRRFNGEHARTGYGTILDVKVAHRKAKRRSIVKDKKREIHRQNERHRHHSVNLAIQELSQLVPCLEPRRNNTKQNIVQRTGEYMEYLNNKVTAMCDQLRCTKSLCHDSLAMSQILSAVVDGQEEKFPADNPIHLSNLEALLDNMHIENRTYKIRNQAERDDCLISEEEGLGDQKEVKKSFRVQSKGGRMKCDSDFPRGQPFVASPSFHESRSFTSPSVSGSTSLRSQEVVTPGYLGDGEESASPVGTASCTKSLSLSNSSDDISDDGSMDEAAISSAATIVHSRGSLMNTREYSLSTRPDTSKKLLLLTDKSVSKEIQRQRVHYLVDAEQFASIRKCQVADGGSSSAADNVTTTAGFPQLLLIPTTITKLLQIVPAQSSAQNITVTTESPEKGTRLVERSPRGKENRPESTTDQDGKHEDGMDQTSMSSSPVKASCDGQPSNMKLRTDAPGDDQHMETDGYNLFSKINYPHFHQAWPHLDGSDVTNLVSQAWKDLPEEIRNVYSEKASDWLPDEQQKQAKHTSKQ